MQLQSLVNLWAVAQPNFAKIAAILEEGNFLSLYLSNVIHVQVDAWIKSMADHNDGTLKTGCSHLFTKANLDKLVSKIRSIISVATETEGDSMLKTIAATIFRVASLAKTKNAALQTTNNVDYQVSLNRIISSLKRFKKAMSSNDPLMDGSFASHLARVLAVVLPTVCPLHPQCRAAAFESGYSNTDQV